MTLKLTQFIAITLYALVAGALWGPWLSLARIMTSYDAATYLADGQHMIGNLTAVMPPLMVAAAVGVTVMFLLRPRGNRPAAVLTVLALILLIAVITITLAVEVPIDNQVRHWTLSSLPDNWQDIRARWATFHTVRTFLSVAGLMCTIAAALLTAPRPAATVSGRPQHPQWSWRKGRR